MKLLTHKQRILLKVIEELAEKGISSKFMLVKNLFLLYKENNMGHLIKFYNFYPYKYGPFSNECYADLSKLERAGLVVEERKHLVLTEKGKQAASTSNRKALYVVKKTANRFKSDREIRKYVYSHYPEYTVKSEIAPTPEKRYTSGIFTIGYEGKDIDSFLNILIKNEIDVIVDVRKNPFSMKFNFTKNKLKNYLKKVDIQYVHIPELGIEGKLRDDLSTMEDYQNLFEQYKATTLKERSDQIERIVKLGEKHRASLMCFEASKNFCHRGIIAENIKIQYDVGVTHL
ncbi:MAG TPA: DUF488 family protein [Methanosarcinaceae archaeon]|nr:DUF488 family protein [Methanosarcinaceae archaeon]